MSCARRPGRCLLALLCLPTHLHSLHLPGGKYHNHFSRDQLQEPYLNIAFAVLFGLLALRGLWVARHMKLCRRAAQGMRSRSAKVMRSPSDRRVHRGQEEDGEAEDGASRLDTTAELGYCIVVACLVFGAASFALRAIHDGSFSKQGLATPALDTVANILYSIAMVTLHTLVVACAHGW